MGDTSDAVSGAELVEHMVRELESIDPGNELLLYFKPTDSNEEAGATDAGFYRRFAMDGVEPKGENRIANFWANYFLALREEYVKVVKDFLLQKKVHITRAGSIHLEGVCVAVNTDDKVRFILELDNGQRQEFIPHKRQGNLMTDQTLGAGINIKVLN